MSTVLAGSHIPLIIKAVKAIKKPVLEMGIGYNSTPLLHWMCIEQDLPLLSLENDKKWIERFLEFRTDSHKVEFVSDWDLVDIDRTDWGLVLIDHRPALRRRVDALRLRDNSDIILIHDSEPEIDRFYGYTKIYKHFKYKYTYNKVKPNTTALSNKLDLERIFS